MDEQEKQAQAEVILKSVVLARLATASARTLQPHVVPVWFYWDGESAWISAFSSTRKVKDLLTNLRCALLVEPEKPADGRVQAVLLEGAAELISEPDLVERMSALIYERYMCPEDFQKPEPQSWLRDPENRIIRLKPEKRFVF